MTHPTLELNDAAIRIPPTIVPERHSLSKPWRIAWVIGGLAIVVVGAMVFAVHVAGALQ